MKGLVILCSLFAAVCAVVESGYNVNGYNYGGQQYPGRNNEWVEIPGTPGTYYYRRDNQGQRDPRRNNPQQYDPYGNVPAQRDPRHNNPQQYDPYGNVPAQRDPIRNIPQQYDPYGNVAAQRDPRRNIPQQYDPYGNVPAQRDPRRNNPQQYDPYDNFPAQRDPRRNIPQQYDPYGNVPAQRDPRRNIPQQYDPSRNTPAQRYPGRNIPQQNDPRRNNNGQTNMPPSSFSNIDYCAMGCDNHTACASTKQYDETNCRNIETITLTDSLKQLFIDLHNAKRDSLAAGQEYNHPPACRMGTMQWNDELAYLAATNVKKCKYGHDQCWKTKDFDQPGQNLAWASWGIDHTYNNVEQIKSAIEGWFKEIQYSNRNIIENFNYNGPHTILHFTGMSLEHNTQLGCAAATVIKVPEGGTEEKKFYKVACNYAYITMPNEPIYTVCRNSAEKCTSGRNRKYQHLCSENEEYKK